MPATGLVGRRGSVRLAAAAALALAACAGGSDRAGPAPSATTAAMASSTAAPATTTATTAPVTTSATPSTSATTAPAPAGAEREAADPVRVEIPAIGVDAPVVPLGLDEAGALEPPAGTAEAGWWTGGPEPGEAGPAVIAGHVDSRRGPAVFFRLRDLRPGDAVAVVRADGSRATFTVDRQERHPKAAFPTDAVYGDTPGSALRLVTCGGAFDRSTGHYVDNLIVFATRR